MRRGQLAGLFLSLLAFALPAMAQANSVEYGRPDELRGVTKVFIDTGIDGVRRDAMVKEIRKQLPNLEVVSTPEESDIHLRFNVKDVEGGKTKATGSVVKLVGNERVRVLFSYDDDTPSLFGNDTLLNSGAEYARPLVFARQFVKLYKKANG